MASIVFQQERRDLWSVQLRANRALAQMIVGTIIEKVTGEDALPTYIGCTIQHETFEGDLDWVQGRFIKLWT